MHFSSRETYKLKVRGWKTISHANGDQKNARVAILITEKIDFKMKNILSNKEGHYIIIKGYIHEEDITILNIYAPNIGSPQYIIFIYLCSPCRGNRTRNGGFPHLTLGSSLLAPTLSTRWIIAACLQ